MVPIMARLVARAAGIHDEKSGAYCCSQTGNECGMSFVEFYASKVSFFTLLSYLSSMSSSIDFHLSSPCSPPPPKTLDIFRTIHLLQTQSPVLMTCTHFSGLEHLSISRVELHCDRHKPKAMSGTQQKVLGLRRHRQLSVTDLIRNLCSYGHLPVTEFHTA